MAHAFTSSQRSRSRFSLQTSSSSAPPTPKRGWVRSTASATFSRTKLLPVCATTKTIHDVHQTAECGQEGANRHCKARAYAIARYTSMQPSLNQLFWILTFVRPFTKKGLKAAGWPIENSTAQLSTQPEMRCWMAFLGSRKRLYFKATPTCPVRRNTDSGAASSGVSCGAKLSRFCRAGPEEAGAAAQCWGAIKGCQLLHRDYQRSKTADNNNVCKKGICTVLVHINTLKHVRRRIHQQAGEAAVLTVRDLQTHTQFSHQRR